jgi:hypothetical protein
MCLDLIAGPYIMKIELGQKLDIFCSWGEFERSSIGF